MATFDVQGNHGLLSVDCLTGLVLYYHQYPNSGDTYEHITQFDVTEYLGTYPTENLEGRGVDILDIGYWYQVSDDIRLYEPPEADWRAEYRAQVAAGELSPYPCGLLR
jgi:hypothetical protein